MKKRQPEKMSRPLRDLLTKLQAGGMKLNREPYCLQCRSAKCKNVKHVYTTAFRCDENYTVYRVGVHEDQK